MSLVSLAVSCVSLVLSIAALRRARRNAGRATLREAWQKSERA